MLLFLLNIGERTSEEIKQKNIHFPFLVFFFNKAAYFHMIFVVQITISAVVSSRQKYMGKYVKTMENKAMYFKFSFCMNI